MGEAISNCSFSNLDRKCWSQVFTSQHAKNIDIPYTIPSVRQQACTALPLGTLPFFS